MGQYDAEKKIAANEAVKYVKDNMILGVGSGTTVKYFIDALSERVKDGLNIKAVPTSKETRRLCEAGGIECMPDKAVPTKIDLTVDGADEFDLKLNMIKGGGGCLLWEKIVASVSEFEIIIVDSSKKTDILGKKFHLPVEVIPYAVDAVQNRLGCMSVPSVLRTDESGQPFITDEGNYILDCNTGEIPDIEGFLRTLQQITGIVENGLFVRMADIIIEGSGDKINKYTSMSPVITDTKQKDTFEAIDRQVHEFRQSGAVPVVELDLDLTTFVPYERTVLALRAAGDKYQIPEFQNPAFDLVPGYTREAWVNFISRNKLPDKYPSLRWMGEKDGKDGDSVYSAFHTAFWNTDYLRYDTLTPGLSKFIRRLQKAGAVVVFVSGRWKEEQIEPTRYVLKKEGLEDVPLLIGNPGHDTENPISDSQIKALHQAEIKEKYGVPAVFIDDRKENRDAVCAANPECTMLSVGCAISGFTFDEETTGVSLGISSFM
jgi:ribose 5-phosphate isomerase